MDIEAVQSKAGSNVQFLPVILLERRWGGEGGCGRWRQGERRRGWLLCHRKHMLLAFSSSRRGDASPSTALQTVWHTGHRRKPLERSQPPASSMERGSAYFVWARVCACPYVAAYASQMQHCAGVIGGFSTRAMSETHNMAAAQRHPEKQRVILLLIPQR